MEKKRRAERKAKSSHSRDSPSSAEKGSVPSHRSNPAKVRSVRPRESEREFLASAVQRVCVFRACSVLVRGYKCAAPKTRVLTDLN